MRSCSRSAVALAVALVAAVLAAGAGATGGPDPGFGYGPDVRTARAVIQCQALGRNDRRYRACLTDAFTRLVISSRDSADELPRIDRYVHRVGGFIEANCHVLMHAVGRRYAKHVHLTLGRLLHYLPKSNDAGCSAGFGHGLLMELGPQIVQFGPTGAAVECHKAPTRYQRYSCIHGLGHAYMRLYGETIPFALDQCRALGPRDAQDCAQGAYHDYWISVAGLDATHRPRDPVTSPRALCGRQPLEFVRACWYRALLERPPAKTVDSTRTVLAVCRGLQALQHGACLTGAALISSPDPFEQMRICAGLRSAAAASCVRGVRAPAVALNKPDVQVKLIRDCANFDHSAQHGCYLWLGKALNVVTNGHFEHDGCPQLRYDATRAACGAGASSYEGPLQTFS